MFDIHQPVPAYLLAKSNIVRLIIFTAAFALLFINMYAPFDLQSWYKVTKWQLLVYSSLVTLTGVLVVVVSRIIMYHLSHKVQLQLWHYLVWVFAEVLSMALFYVLFENIFLNDPRSLPECFKITVQNTALILLLPYSASWLYFSWKEKKQKIDDLTHEQSTPDTSKNMIPFHDEKGILRFSLKSNDLLYLESADNYVSIYYLNKGKVLHFLLRNTLKTMEELFKGNPVIIRCHRSYIINFEKAKLLRKEKDGLLLELDAPELIDIPVSKSYVDKVMETFSHFCSNTD